MELRQRLAGVHLAPAPVVEDTGADTLGITPRRLGRQIRVADERAAHSDEIAITLRDHLLGALRRADAPERHDRQAPGGAAHAAVQADERRLGKVHVGHVILETRAEVALAVGEVVDDAQACQMARDALGLLGIDTSGDALVGRHLEPGDETAAATCANALGDLAHEAHASFESAAIAVLPGIGPGREKLSDQIAVRAVQLDAGESAALESLGHRHEGVHQPLDVARRQHVGHGPAQRVGLIRHPHRRSRGMPQLLPAGMPELSHETGTGLLDGRRRAREAVVVRIVVAGDDGAVRERLRVHGDDLAHDETGAAARAGHEEIGPALGHPVCGTVVGERRGQGDAVADLASANTDR